MRKKLSMALFALAAVFLAAQACLAADYVIDTHKAHAFIQFKISHLGYSFVLGRFDSFEGEFSYDPADPSASKVSVTVDTASVDTNQAERDKHLRSDKFLDVQKYPKATFVSTSFEPTGKDTAKLKGNFTLHGVTRPIVIDVRFVGAGNDPWGGYRRGFEGSTRLVLADYDINYDLGPTAKAVDLYFSFEGIRKK